MSTVNNKAAIPNPALEPFTVFIGEWETVGTHPALPGITLHGQCVFEWLEGGAFLIMHTSNEEAQIPTGIAIFSSDNTRDEFFMIYYDDRKVSRKYDVTFKDNVLRWWRTGPEFSQRYSFTISEDRNTIIGKGEMLKDGGDWEPDLDQTFKRLP